MPDRIEINICKDRCENDVTEEDMNPLTVIAKACEIISLAVEELTAWMNEEKTDA